MAKNTVPRGETSVIRHIFIMDSTSTAGAGKTALAYNTASLTAYYLYPGGTAASLTLEDISTLGTYSAPTSNAHLRFKKIDDTNMPGWYEIQFHNDWFSVANGRKAACVQLKGATGMAPLNLEIDCIGMEVQSATPSVDSTKIGGTTQTGRDIGASVLLSSGTGTGQISLSSGAVTVGTNNDKTGYTASTVSDKTGYSLTATTGLGNQTANITGNLSGSVGSISGVTFPTNFADLNITATTGLVRPDMANASGNYAGTVATVTTLTNLPAITSNWLTAAGLAADAGTEIGAAVLSALGTGSWASAIPWNAAWDAEVQSECTDALNAYDPPTNTEMEARTLAAASYATAANLATVDTVVDAILADTGTDGVVVAAASKTGYALAAAGLDSVVVETGLNARQALAVIAASAAGIVAGAATATITIKAAQEGTTTRVTATCDADGNRSAVTLNLPS